MNFFLPVRTKLKKTLKGDSNPIKKNKVSSKTYTSKLQPKRSKTEWYICYREREHKSISTVVGYKATLHLWFFITQTAINYCEVNKIKKRKTKTRTPLDLFSSHDGGLFMP